MTNTNESKHTCQFCDKEISQKEIFATTDDACYKCCEVEMLDQDTQCINNICPNYPVCSARINQHHIEIGPK